MSDAPEPAAAATTNASASSPVPTLVDEKNKEKGTDDTPAPATYSAARKYVLLVIFCLAQFLDTVNNSSLYSAIPSLVVALGMNEAESTWIISAFQLTFASFLLIVSFFLLSARLNVLRGYGMGVTGR